jgi:hypothetical protein
LVLIEPLPGFYPALTADYEWIGDSAVRITVPEYSPGRRDPVGTRVYDVR